MKKDDYVQMSATYFVESFRKHGRIYREDPKVWSHIYNLGGVLDKVTRSQKFFFGSERHFEKDVPALSHTAKEFFLNGLPIIPYPDCWLEWEYSYKNFGDYADYPNGGFWVDHHSKNVCLVSENSNGLSFQQFGGGLGCDRESVLTPWWFSGWIMNLDFDGKVTWSSCEEVPSPADSSGRDGPPWIGPAPSDFMAMDTALACLAMLMARETKVVEKRPPAGLVEHRIKKGHAPLFSHKVVTINPQRIVYEGDSHPSGIRRASPRLHWRRGHVRTLSTGQKIGIPPCIVGAAENGILDKTYRVKLPASDNPPENSPGE